MREHDDGVADFFPKRDDMDLMAVSPAAATVGGSRHIDGDDLLAGGGGGSGLQPRGLNFELPAAVKPTQPALVATATALPPALNSRQTSGGADDSADSSSDDGSDGLPPPVIGNGMHRARRGADHLVDKLVSHMDPDELDGPPSSGADGPAATAVAAKREPLLVRGTCMQRTHARTNALGSQSRTCCQSDARSLRWQAMLPAPDSASLYVSACSVDVHAAAGPCELRPAASARGRRCVWRRALCSPANRGLDATTRASDARTARGAAQVKPVVRDGGGRLFVFFCFFTAGAGEGIPEPRRRRRQWTFACCV
jgi:hypothetical protein